MDPPPQQSRQRYPSPRTDLQQKCNRGSHCSDTSSAYSGSDTMASVHSSSIDADEIDLSGLVESVVDSDEEDLAESMDSLNVRDVVRDCLEKDPSERTEEDIDTLVEFTQGLKAFSNITLAVRRALCSVMVFAVVDKAGTVVMSDGEELDSWSVLINGHVEIEHANGEKEDLQMGDSFGILPTMDKLYHRGVMRTKCDDCQFVCITQTDYYRIQHQGEENTRRHEDAEGRVVMVTELRQIATSTATSNRRGHVVIRGTVERLLLHLVEENSMTDPTYVEDFLLTHRIFMRNPQDVTQKLLEWFENDQQVPEGSTATPQEIRDRVTRVVLLWVNNHFTDFETDDEMLAFLEVFEMGLQRNKLLGQLRLLHIACAAKARMRTITLTRSSRDESLHFKIVGGYDMRGTTPTGNGGIFISHVECDSKAQDVGLKRGDQILEVNGQSFDHVTNKRALEILTGSTHLSITVKSNLLAFKSTTMDQVDCCPQSPGMTTPTGGNPFAGNFVSSIRLQPAAPSSARKDSVATANGDPNMGGGQSKGGGGFMTLGPKRRIQKALMKMKNLGASVAHSNSNSGLQQANDDALLHVNSDAAEAVVQKTPSSKLYQSQSNPDLTSSCYDDATTAALATPYLAAARPSNAMLQDYPEHVLKVYRADQTCKYLLINKETTAHEVVMLALHEFGIHDPSSNFSLCEVSVGEGGMVKQRRLPDQLQNLAERIGLSARYYLKTIGSTENLVPDELALELLRESTVHFLQLNAYELAVQLTLQDFAIFRQIESTEYVDDLFDLKSKYGVPMLAQFAELVNREMFWVVSEVCGEHNIVRRMKIVKQFIKIARHCKECRNFNSMFAIISGLGHAAVSRLRQTWEKLPSKYQRLFSDLQDLMDPSRNMSKYRQLVTAEYLSQLPIIPFYPVVKKDLTFIHLGNDTRVENLINFEKLRMIAKEVRMLTHMCSSQYDLQALLEFKAHSQHSAISALNQMTTSGTQIAANAGQSTVKRRKKSTTAPNPKKMFEEAQMVRRVKSYLNHMKIITDEDTLHKLSLECEPPHSSRSGDQLSIYSHTSSSSAPNSSLSMRKRQPSPTRSTTSSTSSTSENNRRNINNSTCPKFGTASPQAVKKILSLAETTKVRTYQPRHGGIALPLVANPHHVFNSHAIGVPVAPASASASANPSPSSLRRLEAGCSMPAYGTRSIHERSHSDTMTPLPSVDLSVESSSVTSFSNLPLRKSMISGSLTSNDSGHGSYAAQHDSNSVCSATESGLFHLVPNTHHMAARNAANSQYFSAAAASQLQGIPASAQWCTMPGAYHGGGGGVNNSGVLASTATPPPPPPRPPSRGPRHPPAYSVAAHMAHMQRLGRAHSLEGVLSPTAGLSVSSASFYHSKSANDADDDDDDEAQVSAV